MKDKIREKHLNIIFCFCAILYIFSVVFHTYYEDSFLSGLINFISFPLLYPLLLFTIGTIIYDKEYDKNDLLIKARNYFVIGLIINVIMFICISFTKSKIDLFLLANTNIFIYVGFVCLLMQVFKNLNLDGKTVWGIGFIFSITNLLLSIWLMDGSQNTILNYLISNYITTTSFPLLAFMIFPCSGYAFRELTLESEKKQYAKNMIIGILGFDFFIYLLAKLSDADTLTFFTDIKFFYNMDVIYSFALILLCVALYSFLYLIAPKFKKKIYEYIKFISDNLVMIAIVSNLLIYILLLLIFYMIIKLNIYQIFFIFIIISLLTYFIVKKLTKSK